MTDWTESVSGPRSLLTGPDIAITACEDPAVFVVHFGERQLWLRDRLSNLLDHAFTCDVGETGALPSGGFILRRTEREWWLVPEREKADILREKIAGLAGQDAVAVNLTGHFSALRLAGAACREVLARVANAPMPRRFTTADVKIGEADCIAVQETSGNMGYLVLLVPRSRAQATAERLVEAGLAVPRLGLL
jgi:glycine cleavage system aminomethyltransferase T